MGTPMSLESALADDDYVTLVCFGFKQRADGEYVMRVATDVVVKRVSDATWETLRERMIMALDKLRETPMDDLERRML